MAVAGYEYRINGGAVIGVGNVLTTVVSGLTANTQYAFEVRAYDVAGNRSAWSPVSNVTTNPVPPAPVPYSPTVLGADLIVYLRAASITGVDGDPVALIANQGAAANFSQAVAGSRPLLKIVGGSKLVRHDGLGDCLYSDAPITGIGPWTFYAIVKSASSAPSYFFTGADDTKAIVHGFAADKWEYFTTPRTELATIDTANFIILKCVVGTLATGVWYAGAATAGLTPWAGDWKVIIAVNRLLTAAEQLALENWLATQL